LKESSDGETLMAVGTWFGTASVPNLILTFLEAKVKVQSQNGRTENVSLVIV